MHNDVLGIGLTGKSLTDLERKIISETSPYAVVLFGRNIADPRQLRDLIREVKAIAGARLTNSAMEAVEEAEALILTTEWNEFANVDLALVKEKMHTPMIFDGRNLFDPETMRQLGFHYISIGRPRVKPA